MNKPGKLILALKRRAKQAKTAWERRELENRARDIASAESKAWKREEEAALRGDMAGAF